MFFTNIATWSQKKLRLYSLIFNLLYLVATAVVPIVIVGCRYQIFNYASKVKLTGWGWVCAIVVAVVTIRVLKKVISKLPESTLNQQRLKYSLLMVRALFIPILLIVAMAALKKDFDLAYNTLWWCLISYSVGILIDYLCILYLDRERQLREKADEQIEVNKRIEAKTNK